MLPNLHALQKRLGGPGLEQSVHKDVLKVALQRLVTLCGDLWIGA